jgi:hypothetical protein
MKCTNNANSVKAKYTSQMKEAGDSITITGLPISIMNVPNTSLAWLLRNV